MGYAARIGASLMNIKRKNEKFEPSQNGEVRLSGHSGGEPYGAKKKRSKVAALGFE
jgi:hypothetical protein